MTSAKHDSIRDLSSFHSAGCTIQLANPVPRWEAVQWLRICQISFVTWRIIPVSMSPKDRVVGPLPNHLNGLYMGGYLLTTYKSWNDPPSKESPHLHLSKIIPILFSILAFSKWYGWWLKSWKSMEKWECLFPLAGILPSNITRPRHPIPAEKGF